MGNEMSLSTQPQTSSLPIVEAIEHLRKGTLWYLIVEVLQAILAVALIAAFILPIMTASMSNNGMNTLGMPSFVSTGSSKPFIAIINHIITLLWISAVGAIALTALYIVFVYMNYVKGLQGFCSTMNMFCTSRTLYKWLTLPGLLIVVAGVLICILIMNNMLSGIVPALATESTIQSHALFKPTLLAGLIGGLIIIIIGGILALIGLVGLLIAFFEMGSKYQETNITIGAVLVLIGIILRGALLPIGGGGGWGSIVGTVMDIIGLILLYTALGNIKSKVVSMTQAGAP
jgi:hypothetical protein